MREKPILFSGPMVRAILEGSKTQTRRVLRVQPSEETGSLSIGPYHPTAIDRHGEEQPGPETYGVYSSCGEFGLRCPYGQPGDRLWVRETWAKTYVRQAGAEWFVYATGDNRTDYGGPWKPSIHMPRAASRITLEITGVRVERLGEISESDARAEGVQSVAEFKELWASINGLGSWEANPWVWVVEFRRI